MNHETDDWLLFSPISVYTYCTEPFSKLVDVFKSSGKFKELSLLTFIPGNGCEFLEEKNTSYLQTRR